MNTNQKALLIARAMIQGESGAKAGGRVNIQSDYARRLVRKAIQAGLAAHSGDLKERNIKAYRRDPDLWLGIVALAAKAWEEE